MVKEMPKMLLENQRKEYAKNLYRNMGHHFNRY